MRVIYNKDKSIGVPWEPGLLEWLIDKYPHSGYHEEYYER